VSRHVLPTGRIERLSVAVLIDGKPVVAGGADAPEGGAEGEPVAAFTPWTTDEIAEFEQLAKRAVGFSAERGDEISVINAPFQALDADFDEPSPLTPDVVAILMTIVQGVVFLIGLFLFARLFVRPLAAAVGGPDPTAAVKDLRKEVLTKLASVQAELTGGVVSPELAAAVAAAAEEAAAPALEGGGARAAAAGARDGGEASSGRSGQGAIAGGRGGAGDFEIPGLMDPNGSIPLPAQVDRLAQLRPEDSVRTIRGWMSSGS